MALFIQLTSKEREKLAVITRAIRQEITNNQAVKLLGISLRQVKRLKHQVRVGGRNGIAHKLRGKPSNHHYSLIEKGEILQKIKEKYVDFKPKFATEKLQENDNISMTSQTIRVWMSEAGFWKPKSQKRVVYRSWRARREYFGELQQFDGSYHFWLENRYLNKDGEPVEMCLLAAIDDATGKITKATFSPHEGVVPVFTFWQEYIQELGKPLAIYLDKFSTYKINHKMAVDNEELMTQFQRAMKTLEVDLISANSPQAKGRVERLFLTLQDRLVKEMRLAGIKTPQEANCFLTDIFIPKFNQQFCVTATKEGDLHKELTKENKDGLNRIFSVQSTRRVNPDFTIQFKNHWYQLAEIQPTTIRPKETVLVEIWINNSTHFSFLGKYLNFQVLPKRPIRHRDQPVALTNHKLIWRPPLDHPWLKVLGGDISNLV